MKVIIADDSNTIRRIEQNMLADLGHTDVLFADGGDVVMELLKEHKDVCLVLMDWNMPVMNGLDCLKAIRAAPETCKLAVVMVTSEALLERIRVAVQCGATNYLVKPFEFEKFKQVVGGILGQSVPESR